MTEGPLGRSVHTAEDNRGCSLWTKRCLHIPPAEQQQVTQEYDTGGNAMCVG